MDRAAYELARTELSQKLKAAQSRVEMLQAAISGLDITFREVGHRTQTSSAGRGQLKEAIQDAVSKMSDDTVFGVAEIIASVEVDHPMIQKPARSTVTGVLTDIAKDGGLVLVEGGSGRRASKYRKNTTGGSTA